jgi:predicted Zn-dependent protease
MTGTIAPAAADIRPYTPVLDATADRLSLYMLARAGYGIDNALRFWKRLASQYPATVQDSHTALHPASAYRFSVMTQVTQNIKAKQKHRRPLMP